jgi:hypothetical protein
MRFEWFFLQNLHFSFFLPCPVRGLFLYSLLQSTIYPISDPVNICNIFRVYSKLVRCRWLSETQRASLLQDLLRLTENLPTNSTERFALLFFSKTCLSFVEYFLKVIKLLILLFRNVRAVLSLNSFSSDF